MTSEGRKAVQGGGWRRLECHRDTSWLRLQGTISTGRTVSVQPRTNVKTRLLPKEHDCARAPSTLRSRRVRVVHFYKEGDHLLSPATHSSPPLFSTLLRAHHARLSPIRGTRCQRQVQSLYVSLSPPASPLCASPGDTMDHSGTTKLAVLTQQNPSDHNQGEKRARSPSQTGHPPIRDKNLCVSEEVAKSLPPFYPRFKSHEPR